MRRLKWWLRRADKDRRNMKGFKSTIEGDAVANSNFRKVLYTSKNSQLVLMSLHPLEEIGMETHRANDQFFRVEKGHGKCIIDGNEYELKDGDAVIVPCGARHNIVNLSNVEDLKLYTIYSPPHHKDGILRATKQDAEADEEEFDGNTTEQFRNSEVDHVRSEATREHIFISPAMDSENPECG
jgi:mannose-6-phosphate isomerase-like protein (cupin superfamily)